MERAGSIESQQRSEKLFLILSVCNVFAARSQCYPTCVLCACVVPYPRIKQNREKGEGREEDVLRIVLFMTERERESSHCSTSHLFGLVTDLQPQQE